MQYCLTIYFRAVNKMSIKLIPFCPVLLLIHTTVHVPPTKSGAIFARSPSLVTTSGNDVRSKAFYISTTCGLQSFWFLSLLEQKSTKDTWTWSIFLSKRRKITFRPENGARMTFDNSVRVVFYFLYAFWWPRWPSGNCGYWMWRHRAQFPVKPIWNMNFWKLGPVWVFWVVPQS